MHQEVGDSLSDTTARLFQPFQEPATDRQVSVGRWLVEQGIIAPWQLFFAMNRQQTWRASLVDILLSRGWITDDQALSALSEYYQIQVVDLHSAPPDFRLQKLLSPQFCLKHGIVPWISLNGYLTYATSRPEQLDRIRDQLPMGQNGFRIALAKETQIQSYLARAHKDVLTPCAEDYVADNASCREWGNQKERRYAYYGLLFFCLIVSALLHAHLTFIVLSAIALLVQAISASMKVAALFASKRYAEPVLARQPRPERLPRISVMVPLFRETEIAVALVRRLSRLTYPKTLLDVVLVLEEKDETTQNTLAKAQLPRWMRVVVVPDSTGLTTKPRALNYALDFCRGDIIGIWDAEDAPAPNQLECVARHFASAPPDVACLQGILDYYNPYTNWISRCFTLEYSMWFRIVLRGMARLGAAIPLGGTTLFLRREVIEEVGRWDAHNVTEDADLGIRLSRFGYRTELTPTVTQEEANCHLPAWIKQRSRWLKGYMVTYLVHMRQPTLLWRELGPRKFIGFNAIFATTLLQFLLAPLIWSFWLLCFGLSIPVGDILPMGVIYAGVGLLLIVTAIELIVAVVAMSGQNRRGLIPWALTLPIYFGVATFGAYKALYELVFHPFYWDKTSHGQTPEGKDAEFSAVSAEF
jgi:cellulose synthase/poly-beta-1,6-N-acetylglucosamine synthase-like glycosyltransferase